MGFGKQAWDYGNIRLMLNGKDVMRSLYWAPLKPYYNLPTYHADKPDIANKLIALSATPNGYSLNAGGITFSTTAIAETDANWKKPTKVIFLSWNSGGSGNSPAIFENVEISYLPL